METIEEEILKEIEADKKRISIIGFKDYIKLIKEIKISLIDTEKINIETQKCYLVSKMVKSFLDGKKIYCQKVAIFGQTKLKTVGIKKIDGWFDHQAVIVKVKSKRNRRTHIEIMVIDPFFPIEKPLFFEKWLSVMSNLKVNDEKDEIFAFSITFPSYFLRYKDSAFSDIYNLDKFHFLRKDETIIESNVDKISLPLMSNIDRSKLK